MTRNRFFMMSLCLLAASCMTYAGKDDPDSVMQIIKTRMKARYPSLARHKADGTIGETAEGYVEAVSDEVTDEAKRLVTYENADRKELYGMIARQTNTSFDDVAANNAYRIYKKATEAEVFKSKKGVWRTKKEIESGSQ